MSWSFFRPVLRSLSGSPRPTVRRRPLRGPIETLEDRSVPSALPLTPPRPVANHDWADTDGSTPITVAVLANDTPAPNLMGGPAASLVPATLRLAAGPHHGKVTIDRVAGTVTYTAAAGFTGSDRFAYTVGDAAGVASRPAAVTIQVNRPVAADDWTDTDAGNPVVIDVLENDADPDGAEHIHQPGSVAIVSQPAHGTATVDPTTNLVTYTPAAGFGGTDSFRYTVTDDAGATSPPARVLVRVNRPTANDDFAVTSGSAPVVIGVLENDSDPDGKEKIEQPGSVSVLTPPVHGTATVVAATNQVTYTPFPGFAGTDTFTYTVTDEAGATSAPGTVTVVVGSPGGPTGPGDFATDTDGRNPVSIQIVPADPVSGKAPGVLAIAGAPHHGRATVVGSTGEIVYRAAAGFGGTDSFRYRLRLPTGTLVTGTVSVVVNRPTAADDWTDTDAGNPVTFDVLENDTDPDGAEHIHQPGAVRIVSSPLHGQVSVDPTTNAVTYTPARGFGGTDSFRYLVIDDAGARSAPATAFVRVNRPTAAADGVETQGTTPIVIDVLENDSDPDGHDKIEQPGSVQILTRPAHGTVTVDATTNDVTYTARPGFVGTDTFRYTVTDEAGAKSAPATVTVLVTGPTAAAASFLVSGGQATLFLLGAPPAPGGEGPPRPTITIVRGPAFGTLTVDHTTGVVTYTAGAGFRRDSFVYTVTDASGTVSTPAEIDLIGSGRMF